jgi:RNA polymerase sigma-70 factor (ECF subfamily)
MQTKSDADLMCLVLEKHRPALEELYDRYVKLVYSFALKSTKEEQAARLIVQAVFTRLWTTETGFDPAKGQFINWLLMITRNITIDHLRKQKRERLLTTIEQKQWEQISDNGRNNPLELVSRKMLREQVQKAYRFLSQSQIELIHFLYWEGYSLSEIAKMRDEPIGTIKSRLHQTLKTLRNHLTLEMEE